MFFHAFYFYVFFYFKKLFLCFLMSLFCSCQNINVQNYKYDLFLMGKLHLAVFDFVLFLFLFSTFRFFRF